jgi:hypothetical protein
MIQLCVQRTARAASTDWQEIHKLKGRTGLTSQSVSGHSEEGSPNWQAVEVNLADGKRHVAKKQGDRKRKRKSAERTRGGQRMND